MQLAPTQFPFTRVFYGQQPFGLRVQCILDSSLICKHTLVTGLAIESTGGMEPYFGLGPFSRGLIKEIGQSLGCFLGELDKQGGTSIIYWGTNDSDAIQSLGFRKATDWSYYSFLRPTGGFVHKSSLYSAVNYFLTDTYLNDRKLINPDQEGIFVFILDGSVDDYAKVLDYVGQLTQDMIAGRRNKMRLIFVGIGENFIEASQGQIQALASYSGKTDPPIIASLVVHNLQDLFERIKDVLMLYFTIGKSGSLLDDKGGIIRNYPDGLPGAFQFYVPVGSSHFNINIDGTFYSQKIPAT